MKSLTKNSQPTARSLEPEAFYQGAHRQKIEPALAEISALFNQRKTQAESLSTERVKGLEASIEYLSQRAPEAERRWLEMQERFGNDVPRLAAPLFYVIAGIFAMLAETFMLAPSLDLLNIADLIEQRIAAFAIGVSAAMFFHFAWRTFQPNKYPPVLRMVLRGAGLVAVAALIYLGLVRGYHTAFAATLSDNPLGQFLHENPMVTTVFYVFLTLGLPVAAAIALTFSLKEIGDWQEYRSAKDEARQIPQSLIQSKKQLEMEQEKLKHELQFIEEERNQWNSSYQLHHQRGATIGASRSPYWTVVLKALAAGFTALGLTGWLTCFSPFFLALPIAVLIAAYIYFRHVWLHPTPEEYFDLQNVQFQAVEEESAWQLSKSYAKSNGQASELESAESAQRPLFQEN